VLDALNGLAWRDDAPIHTLHISGVVAAGDEQPSVQVRIAEEACSSLNRRRISIGQQLVHNVRNERVGRAVVIVVVILASDFSPVEVCSRSGITTIRAVVRAEIAGVNIFPSNRRGPAAPLLVREAISFGASHPPVSAAGHAASKIRATVTVKVTDLDIQPCPRETSVPISHS
jgi:hypothetical protein